MDIKILHKRNRITLILNKRNFVLHELNTFDNVYHSISFSRHSLKPISPLFYTLKYLQKSSFWDSTGYRTLYCYIILIFYNWISMNFFTINKAYILRINVKFTLQNGVYNVFRTTTFNEYVSLIHSTVII